jgi:hypothetical protein
VPCSALYRVIWAIRIEDCKFITSALYRLEQTWCSPPVGTVCPRRARCSVACRLSQPACNSPPAHTAACPWRSSRLAPRVAAETPTGGHHRLVLSQATIRVLETTFRLTFLNSRNPNSLRIHNHHPPPLNPQPSTSTHRTPYTRRWQCESRSDVGFSMSRSRWSTALGRGTYGGFVVGEDGQGLLRSLNRQVRRLLARRAASPNPDGRFEHRHSTPATRRPQHDGGTPWSEPAVLRVRVCERAAPVVDKTLTRSKPYPSQHQCRWESPALHDEPPHTCTSTDAPRGFSQ